MSRLCWRVGYRALAMQRVGEDCGFNELFRKQGVKCGMGPRKLVSNKWVGREHPIVRGRQHTE